MTASARIGAQLLQLRQKEGVGLKVIAFRSGVSMAHLSMIERGERNASVEVIAAIAQAVGAQVTLTV